MTNNLTQSDLNQFCGSCTWYQHWTKRILYTDGIKFVADRAGAYWLIDLVASYAPTLKHEPFIVWTLEIHDKSATITARADSDRPILVKQIIEYTDFPFSFSFYLCHGEAEPVLMLKSEY